MLFAHLRGICNRTVADEIVHAQIPPCCGKMRGGVETKVAFRAPMGQPAHCNWLKDTPVLWVCCPREEKGHPENGKFERKMRTSDPHPKPSAVISLQSAHHRAGVISYRATSLKRFRMYPISMLELSVKGVHHQEDKGLGDRSDWTGSHDLPQPNSDTG